MKVGSRALDQRPEPSPEAFERPATINDLAAPSLSGSVVRDPPAARVRRALPAAAGRLGDLDRARSLHEHAVSIREPTWDPANRHHPEGRNLAEVRAERGEQWS